MLIETISSALGPIVVGGGVGLLAGYTGFIKREYSQAFADFVVKIALPIALFVAAANANPKTILNADYALAMGLGLVLAFVAAFIAGKLFFRHDRANASMQALCASFPDMAYCGPPILLATVGSAGLIAMVIGNLIYTIIILPIALMLMGGSKQGQSAAANFWHSVRQPLVCLPILGAILSVSGIKLPGLATDSLDELGKTAGGRGAVLSGAVSVWHQAQLQAGGVVQCLSQEHCAGGHHSRCRHCAGIAGGSAEVGLHHRYPAYRDGHPGAGGSPENL